MPGDDGLGDRRGRSRRGAGVVRAARATRDQRERAEQRAEKALQRIGGTLTVDPPRTAIATGPGLAPGAGGTS